MAPHQSGFSFARVCDLLQKCEDNAKQCGAKSNNQIIIEWFASQRQRLDREGVDMSALTSSLLPALRSDRVYFINVTRLGRIVARALCLGCSRIEQLGAWRQPGSDMDFAECVERILTETPNPVTAEAVTVEEIDQVLQAVAAKCRFSSPKVQSTAVTTSARNQDQDLPLRQLYRRLEPIQAKWFSRLILKDYSPVQLEPSQVFRCINPLLPVLLKIYDDIPTAVSRLEKCNSLVSVKARDDTTGAATSKLAAHFGPVLGVKVGRQEWLKGRSIKHCLQMGRGRMSVEMKMDGEYCQIHIDLSKGIEKCIQIFSKSGKDSTLDRAGLHPAIEASLGITSSGCSRLEQGCILEGELVVYSEKEGKILPFDKIRKHVSRSGTFFHRSDDDSQAHSWEKLMIVYYDILMIDGKSLLGIRHSERFKRLKSLIVPVPGIAELVKRQIVDFGHDPFAASNLRQVFARCIVAREEGLVLKADDPYFDFGYRQKAYHCCAIKLKKEYVGSFGDVGDFAIVGARYDPAKAREYGIPRLRWTHFYVGCLANKDQVRQTKERPRFVVVNVVELNKTQMAYFMQYVSPDYVSSKDADETHPCLHFERGIDQGRRPSIIFPQPPVFDLRCFSFAREANVGRRYTLRFPMVGKIHCDRTWMDAISFDELQKMAKDELETRQPDDSEELQHWIARLERADPRGMTAAVASQVSETSRRTTSQESVPEAEATPQPQHSLPTPGNTSPAEPNSREPSPQLCDAQPAVAGSEDGGGEMKTREVIDLTVSHSSTGSSLKRCSPAPISQRAKFRRLDQSITDASRIPATSTPSPSSSEPLNDITANPEPRNNTSADETAGGVRNANQDAARPQPVSVDQVIGLTQRTAKEAASKTTTPSSHVQLGDESAQLVPAASQAPPPKSELGGGGGPCKHHREDCAFHGVDILVSPCLAGFPWVTEDLLRGHGVGRFETDEAAWNRQLEAEDLGRERRRPKMIIVDARRRDATRAFLRRVDAARLERRERLGRAAMAEVYDWRVLEVVAEQERRTASSLGERRGPRLHRDRCKYEFKEKIWRRHFVGVV